MYCSKCGTEITNQEHYCPKCGTGLHSTYHNQENDGNSTGMNILSFLIPLVGLILYLVWQGTYPVKAKGCGKWALISIVTYAFLNVIGVCSFLTAL